MRTIPLAMLLLTACDGDDTDGTGGTTDLPPRCQDPGPDARVVTPLDAVTETFEGFDTIRWLPEDPRAVVVYFYGGEVVSEVLQDEQVALWNLLWEQRIGVVATSKEDPSQGASWNSSQQDYDRNPELQRLDRLRDQYVADGLFTADTPIFSVGFSDGASMAKSFAAWMPERGWPIVAAAAHSSGGGFLPDVPLVLAVAEHDDFAVVEGSKDERAEQEARGFAAIRLLGPERVVTPEVFLRREEWDDTDAQEAFDDVVALGLVDDAGVRLVPDGDMEAALGAYTRNSTWPGNEAVSQRMHVVWGMHRFNGYTVVEECEFLLDALDDAT